MLKGTLDDFTLPDIIRFLSAAKKTGCIEVTGGVGDGRVFLRDGDVYYGESSRTRGLDQDPSTEAIKAQIEDTVFDLMRWDMTEFSYSSGVEVQPGAAVDLNVDALIEETTQKLEELDVIASKIPSEASVMAMAPNPPATGEINISPDEWRVLVLVSGTRSVTDIADSVGQDSFSVMRTLYGLASHGLIELVETPSAVEVHTEVPSDEGPAPDQPEVAPELEGPDAETDAYIESLSSPLDGSELAQRMDEEFPPFDAAALEDEVVFDPGSGPPGDDARPLAAADDTEAAEGIEQTDGSEIEPVAIGEGTESSEENDGSDHLEGLTDGYEEPAAAAEVEEPVEGVIADLEGAEAEPSPTDIPIGETASDDGAVVDRLAAVKELADLFEKTDEGAAGPPYPAELAAQRERVAAAVNGDGSVNGDGRRRVEDDEEITRGLISRLIDGVKGL